jgi:hypothetical protein
MTFPVKDGDEGLVVFASRCIDKWWRDGGVQEQTEYRMHDLSDGFAIPGFRSQKRTLDNVSTTAVQLRSDDGKKYVELDDKGKITLKSEDGQVVVTKDSVAISALSSVLLSGGGPAVARVGDATICAAGPGHITSGSRKTSSG